MHALDEIYTKRPFYGSRRMRIALANDYGISCCRERVRHLMRAMGIEALYPKAHPRTSDGNPAHRIYPYLLSNIAASYPNHIWGTDITYIRLNGGFCYLVAIIDWYSRYVIAWELASTLEIEFCLANVRRAMEIAHPAIHNSDQGSHFTNPRYTDILAAGGVQISMDGRGRCMDNIFTERLWRTVKYEEVYLKSYAGFADAKQNLAEYFSFYNDERPHSSLDDRTPREVYRGTKNSACAERQKSPLVLSTASTILV